MASNSTEINAFVTEVRNTRGGALVLQCYQCGTCSGSCPVIEEMEYGPRRILHMIQSGMEEEVLSSPDMWRCVSCYSCANRCPRGIEITDLMAELRRMAIQKGYTQDKEAQFGQAFAETVQNHGRMFEPELLTRYYLRVLDIASLLKMVPLGMRMLIKRKLPFLPDRIRDPEEMKRFNVSDANGPKVAAGFRGLRVERKSLIFGLLGAIFAAILCKFGKEKAL